MVGGQVACGASAVWGFRVRPRTDAPREPMGTYIDMQPDGLADVIVPTRVGAHGADIRVVWGAAVGWPAGDWHQRLEVAPDPRRPDQHARWPRGTVDADGDGGSDVVVLWLGQPSAVFVSTTVTASRTLIARGPSPSSAPYSLRRLPTAAVPLGDRDGDGYQDVLVETSVVTHESGGGSTPAPPLDDAPLLAGGPNGPTWTVSTNSTRSPAGAGRCPPLVRCRFEASPADWDGDGFGDLAIAPNILGRTAGGTLRGPTLTLNRDQLATEATFSGPSSDPRSEGTSVRLVPDVDGDGWPDALVWASWLFRARRTTRVVSGAPDAARAVQEFEQRADGYAVYAVGDVDGDDVGDIVVAGGQPLIVDVHRGGATIAQHPTWSLSYPECSDARVQALDVPGDVDGDGRDEIVVGVHSRECGSRVLVLSWSSARNELAVRATWNAPDRSVLDFGAGAL